jgi:hypothetical protein
MYSGTCPYESFGQPRSNPRHRHPQHDHGIHRRDPDWCGIWCAAGKYLTSHPVIAKVLTRWGHIVLPVVLIAVDLSILIEGGALGHQPH